MHFWEKKTLQNMHNELKTIGTFPMQFIITVYGLLAVDTHMPNRIDLNLKKKHYAEKCPCRYVKHMINLNLTYKKEHTRFMH